MWTEDWTRLGIEPTRDLAAIKKAYARQLRGARPDDDAEAYQRLREAYERAQIWARNTWDDEALPEEPVAEVPAEAQPASETVPSLDSEALQRWIARIHDAGWPARIAEVWAETRQQLLEIPLPLQAEASVRFADLVIRESRLPPELVQELLHHFAWLDDFRASRWLGAERLHALQGALDQVIVRPITNADVLDHFAPVLHLQALRKQGRRLRSLWFAMRMGGTLEGLLEEVETQKLKPRLGLDGLSSPMFSGLLSWAQLARLVVLMSCVLVPVGLVAMAQWQAILVLPLLSIPFALIMVLISRWWIVIASFGAAASASGMGLGRALEERWYTFRRKPSYALIGLGLLGGTALLHAAHLVLPDQVEFGLWVAWAIGLLMAWPPYTGHSAVALGCLLVGSIVLQLPPYAVAPETVAGWLPLWVLGGCLLYVRDGEAIPVLSWVVRPVTNSLHLCQMYGARFALAPLLPAVWAAATVPRVHGSSVFLIWVFSILGLGWLQRRLTTAARREAQAAR